MTLCGVRSMRRRRRLARSGKLTALMVAPADEQPTHVFCERMRRQQCNTLHLVQPI